MDNGPCPEALIRRWEYDLGALLIALALLAVIAPYNLLIGLAVFGAVTAVFLLSWARRAGKIERLVQLLDCGQLSRPLLVEPGYVESYYREAGRHSRWLFNFEPRGSARAVERLDWSHAEGFAVAATFNQLYIWAPAYKVLDKCCNGLYIIALDPKWALGRGGVSLNVSTEEGDYARGSVVLREGRLEAEVEFWPVKARSARVELRAQLGPMSLTKTLAKSEGGVAKSVADVGGRPGVYIISGPVMPNLAQKIGIGREEVWGLGRGKYRVRLVVDRPFKTDVYSEEELISA